MLLRSQTLGEEKPDEELDGGAIGLFRLSLLAVAVGLATGLGAVAFRALIGLIHNVFFLGQFSFHYDANAHTAEPHWASS